MPKVDNTSKEIFDARFKFNIRHFMIGMAALIPALILFVVNTVIDVHSSALGWAMFVMFVPFILWALFMVQRMKLVGAYGETILLLIPTFVWLLPGHDQAIYVMIIIAFALILIGTLLYTFGRLGAVTVNHGAKSKWRTAAPILIRLAFVAVSVVATLMVSIIIINWGDHSLKLVPLGDDGIKNYTASAWIVFIAIVTISVALMLVLLGLASQFNIYFVKQNHKTVKESILVGNTKETKIKSNFLNKTISFKPDSKKRRKRK